MGAGGRADGTGMQGEGSGEPQTALALGNRRSSHSRNVHRVSRGARRWPRGEPESGLRVCRNVSRKPHLSRVKG